VTAAYGGSGSTPTYNASSTTFSQTMTQDTTTTTLIVNPKRARAGQPLSLTAIILNPPPGSGPITGQVSFLVLGRHSGPLNCAGLTNNQATLTPTSGNEVTCSLPNPPAAATPMRVTVSYYGDVNYFGSSMTKKIRLR